MGTDSSVGIAIRYGLGDPGMQSRWERYFPHPSRPALRPTQPPYTIGTGSFPVVMRPENGVDHPPHTASRLKKESSQTSTPTGRLRERLQIELQLAIYNTKFNFREK
jgi:hypothetical protein